jgi:uncharacterized repeat protein (TIGR04138 family)
MQEVNFDTIVDIILTKDARYARDAYHFLKEALDFTQKSISKQNRGSVRHVTPSELLDGIRQFTLQQFGPMSVTVLEEWGVRNCHDFGEIVFNMVESGLLAKTDKDSREGFSEGYDFQDVFCKPYWPESRLKLAKPANTPTTTDN